MSTPLTCGIHHLGLSVSDLKKAKDFFIKALNFTLLGEDADYPSAFLTDTVNIITLWQTDQKTLDFDRKKQVGLHHVAFFIASYDQLKSLYQHLNDWPGVIMEGDISNPSPNSNAHHFFIRMPGGPRVEFYASEEEEK